MFWEEMYDTLEPLYPGFKSWLNRCVNDSNRLAFAYYDNGRVAGLAMLKLEDANSGVWKLCTLYVAQFYREKGLGTRLAHKVISYLKELNAQKCYVTLANAKKISFYTSLGFRDVYTQLDAYPRTGRFPDVADEYVLTMQCKDLPDLLSSGWIAPVHIDYLESLLSQDRCAYFSRS